MRYLLNENIALRSWRLVPYAYYIKHIREAKGLKRDEFKLLSLCDGRHDIEDGELLRSLVKKGMCAPAKEGETLSDWQKPLVCDNRYFPALSWKITEKCNFNCLHCFNAADNVPLMSEWSMEEAEKLLDDAQKCGINAFTLTGGEPMMHRNFLDIFDGIYSRGMYVYEINTNGFFITQEILDRIKKVDRFPRIKISFDGIGYHDWLRNRNGAEEQALNAIKLCVKNGFETKVQTNVHRKNIDSLLPTVNLMDELGADEMRIIRTTEAPRWEQNAKGQTLGIEEYFRKMLDFVREFKKTNSSMEIDIWQFMTLFPKGKYFSVRAVECGADEFRETIPVCRGNRGMVSIAGNGNIHPCHQLSGYYEGHGWLLGNVKESGLQPLLQKGVYIDEICATLGTLAEKNDKCGNCPHFRYCCGGCRAIAIALTNDKFGSDPSKCLFWNGGWYDKILTVMSEHDQWTNIKPII